MKKYGIGGNNVNSPVYGVGGVLSSCKTYGNNSVIADLSPKLWCRQGVGITEVGAGVSQWDDQSGNGNHLKQGTGTRRPSKEGDGSILFDGVDNFLKADAFTLNQPTTIYLLAKQVTWTSGDTIFDGETGNTGRLYQSGATPNLTTYAGAAGASTTDLVIDIYSTIAVVFDGASSSVKINNEAESTGNAGASNMGGFTLGDYGSSTAWSNIQVKEVLVFSEAHDAATRAKVISFLQSI